MATNEEASPICRGKNLSWETILLFYNNIPREPMPKAKFHAYVESRINGWTQTHSQIARQLAFYYEKDGICYPRFCDKVSYTDLFSYMQNWACKYFIPNPYAPSLKGKKPTCIYAYVKRSILNGQRNFDKVLDSIFDIKLSSHDKVNVYLSNFTDIIIDGAHLLDISDRTYGQDTDLYPDEECAIDALKYYNYYSMQLPDKTESSETRCPIANLQQIFYGAPGTGKSNKIENCTTDENRIRTTFHPDSDYSTFVGAYKPTMEETGVTVAGKKETRIAYKYVPQAFLKAYVNAWKRIDKGDNSPYFLVIEEINRGNCAQIFGDLFQLLDRGDDGESKYSICPDEDIKRHLVEQFKNTNNIPEAIKNGDNMRLPSNLYIWATMNTSDQSLFPIDSAFKRRWDWEYMPIEKGDKDFVIEIGSKKYDWWNFISIINSKIDEITGSEDKKLGYWFAKPAGNDTIISCNQFVSKVLFYLWNDVYKDYTDDNRSIFRITEDNNSKKVAFTEFFGADKEAKLYAFMKSNRITEIQSETEPTEK